MADGNQEFSTDDPDELFDLVNEADEVIGTVRRGQAHSDPRLLHRSVQVLVFDTRGRLFLQRRSRHKDLFAGYWCASASGHVAAGESYALTAERELLEELGISAPLREIGKITVRSEQETEIAVVFTSHSDGPFTCHPVETDGGAFVTARELAEGIKDRRLPLTPAARLAIAYSIERGAWPAAAAIAERPVQLLTM